MPGPSLFSEVLRPMTDEELAKFVVMTDEEISATLEEGRRQFHYPRQFPQLGLRFY